MEREFIIFFLTYCYTHYFKSKAAMARDLGIGLTTLKRILNPPHRFKAGNVAYESMIWYCLTHHIDVAHIFDVFAQQYDRTDEAAKSLFLREPLFWLESCMDRIQKTIYDDSCFDEDARQDLLRMSVSLRKGLCRYCTHPPLFSEHVFCLPARIMHYTSKLYREYSVV